MENMNNSKQIMLHAKGCGSARSHQSIPLTHEHDLRTCQITIYGVLFLCFLQIIQGIPIWHVTVCAPCE